MSRAGSTGADPARPSLLFYCQHLVGIGHLVRSLALCEALATRYRVQLLCGGRLPEMLAVPGSVEVLRLPPIEATLDFRLVSHDPGGDLEATFQARTRQILERYAGLRPSVVAIELFPFGRKKFARELLPLLSAARQDPRRPLVVSSVRDLLVGRPDQVEHDERAVSIANTCFDAVLVHGDPRFSRLEDTFRPQTPLRIPVFYTGYVVRAGARPGETEGVPRIPLVAVSAGSGTQGAALLRAAAEAQPEILRTTGLRMRMVTGPHVAEEIWRWLKAIESHQAGLEVVRSVPSLLPEFQRAAVSVSQGGYNTVLEVLAARVPAVIVPAIEEGDQERERGRRLAGLGLARVLTRDELSTDRLVAEVAAALRSPPAPVHLNLEGARATAEIVAQLEAGRSGLRTPAGSGASQDS